MTLLCRLSEAGELQRRELLLQAAATRSFHYISVRVMSSSIVVPFRPPPCRHGNSLERKGIVTLDRQIGNHIGFENKYKQPCENCRAHCVHFRMNWLDFCPKEQQNSYKKTKARGEKIHEGGKGIGGTTTKGRLFCYSEKGDVCYLAFIAGLKA